MVVAEFGLLLLADFELFGGGFFGGGGGAGVLLLLALLDFLVEFELEFEDVICPQAGDGGGGVAVEVDQGTEGCAPS